MGEILFCFLIIAMLVFITWFLIKINKDTDDYPIKYKKRK